MKFFISTLGCKLNFYDSEKISEELQKRDFYCSIQNPDFIIINSCCVTANATKKTIKLSKSFKKNHKESKIFIVGCAAKVDRKNLENCSDQIFSNLEDLYKYLEKYKKSNSEKLKKYPKDLRSQERTRKFVKIQEGCENFCSFCIVCIARGRSINRSEKEILEEIKNVEEKGFKEIVLTGTNIGAYGCSSTKNHKKTKLANLLKEILKETRIPRIRLSSIGPQYFSDELLELIKNERICNHFHLSLQHTDDEILEKMNRPYTKSDIKNLVEKISSSRKDSCIACDIIVGFPYETDKKFANLEKDLREMQINRIHVFPFSARNGTEAKKFPQNDVKIIKKRTSILRGLASKKWKSFIKNSVGKKQELLIENENFGHSKNYLPVRILDFNVQENDLIEIKIKKIEKEECIAESVKN